MELELEITQKTDIPPVNPGSITAVIRRENKKNEERKDYKPDPTQKAYKPTPDERKMLINGETPESMKDFDPFLVEAYKLFYSEYNLYTEYVKAHPEYKKSKPAGRPSAATPKDKQKHAFHVQRRNYLRAENEIHQLHKRSRKADTPQELKSIHLEKMRHVQQQERIVESLEYVLAGN